MLNCKKTSQLLEEERDHKLSLFNRIRLNWHLLLCVICRRYRNRMNFICQAVESQQDDDTGGLSAEAKEKIQSKLDEEIKQ